MILFLDQSASALWDVNINIEFYCVAAAAVLITGISKSGFAGGVGVLAVPLISLFVTPQFAAAIMLPILFLIDISNVVKYRQHWDKSIVLSLLPGAILGLGVGMLVFTWLNPYLMKLLVGIFAVWFSLKFFLGKRKKQSPQALNKLWVFCVACLSGFMGFVAHAGGPPIKIVLLKQHLEKTRFVGTNSVFFFLMNCIKLPLYLSIGQFSFNSLKISFF